MRYTATTGAAGKDPLSLGQLPPAAGWMCTDHGKFRIGHQGRRFYFMIICHMRMDLFCCHTHSLLLHLQDSEIYAVLLNQIAPDKIHIDLPALLADPDMVRL